MERPIKAAPLSDRGNPLHAYSIRVHRPGNVYKWKKMIGQEGVHENTTNQ